MKVRMHIGLVPGYDPKDADELWGAIESFIDEYAIRVDPEFKLVDYWAVDITEAAK
jgi:hypothetical protein